MLFSLLMRCLNYEKMDCRTGPVLTDLNSKVLQHKIYMILINNFRGSHDLLKGQKCIAVDSKNICVFVFDQLTMKSVVIVKYGILMNVDLNVLSIMVN